jgi:hypothetical protein
VVVAAAVHLLDGPLLGPALDHDAVQRDERARAVRAVLAVDHQGTVRGIGHRAERFEDAIVPQAEGAHRDVNELEAAVLQEAIVAAAGQVEDRPDAEAGQLLKPSAVGWAPRKKPSSILYRFWTVVPATATAQSEGRSAGPAARALPAHRKTTRTAGASFLIYG